MRSRRIWSDGGPAEEAEGVDGDLADLGVLVLGHLAEGLDGAGVLELAVEPGGLLGQAGRRRDPDGPVELGPQGPRQHLDRVDELAALRPGVERPEGAERQGQVLRQRGVFLMLGGLEPIQLAGEQVGQLAQELRVGGDRRVVLDQAGQLEGRPPVGLGEPELPDVFHRVPLAAGQLAEQQPDDDHDHDDGRRDHEELHHEPGRRRLDRRQVGSAGGLSWPRDGLANGSPEGGLAVEWLMGRRMLVVGMSSKYRISGEHCGDRPP